MKPSEYGTTLSPNIDLSSSFNVVLTPLETLIYKPHDGFYKAEFTDETNKFSGISQNETLIELAGDKRITTRNIYEKINYYVTYDNTKIIGSFLKFIDDGRFFHATSVGHALMVPIDSLALNIHYYLLNVSDIDLSITIGREF